MTSPTREAARIRCPGCGTVYDEWWNPTIETELDEGQRRGAVSSTCPTCGHKVAHEILVLDSDGVLEPAGLEAEE